MNRPSRAGSFIVVSTLCILLYFARTTTVPLIHARSPPETAPIASDAGNHTNRRVEGRWASVRASLNLPPLPTTILIPISNSNTDPNNKDFSPNTASGLPTRDDSFTSRIRADLRRRMHSPLEHDFLLPRERAVLHFAPDALKQGGKHALLESDADLAAAKGSSTSKHPKAGYGVGAGRGRAKRMTL